MALNRMVVRELQRELVSVDKERAALEAKSIAIRRLLSSSVTEGTQAKVLSLSAQKRSTTSSSRKHLSIRAMLLDLIKTSPGMTSREATALLTDRGVSGTRKTPLSDRVYHELYRMLHAGVLCRRGEGYAMREVENAPIDTSESVSVS
jgi:hypothetical protein